MPLKVGKIMVNYKMVLAYDGTRYNGWQKQGNTKDTIQGKLEGVLGKLEGKEVEVVGAGRTDAGVHALGQVANVKLEVKISEGELMQYVNQYLPEDIAVISVEKVPLRFHSRLNAVEKTYLYRIYHSEIPDPFKRKYTTTITEELDIEKMRKAASFLVGEFDFKSFCSLKKYKKSTVRTIYSIRIEEVEREIRISIRGDGFLYHMVRIIVGTLIEVGTGGKSVEEMKQILDKKDRQAAGNTASAQGLFLKEVRYEM